MQYTRRGRSAATYRGFRENRKGNWYCPDLHGEPCTVFYGRFEKWGIIIAGELQGEWFDDAHEAMDWILDDAEPEPAALPECFRVLGLTPPATMAAVGAAYRLLAKKHHPDVGGDPREFKAITAAYERARECV